jgi:5-methylcytosine-specific restriction enzyme subunit McrC
LASIKAKNRVCIREFGILIEARASETNPDVGQISSTAFAYLRGLIEQQSSVTHSEVLLKLTTFRRQIAIKFQNYVGVLQTPCGTQIEVLPKLYDGAAPHSLEQTRNQLMKMLRCLNNSPFKNGGLSEIRDARMPLLEVYIAQFLSLTNKLIKHGIRSDYVRRQSNTVYLKGRLLISRQLRENALHPERFCIESDEYLIDRPSNRLIKAALKIVRRASQSAANQKLARELNFAFDEVPESKDIQSDFQKVRINRSMEHYRAVLDWCDLILNGHGPTPSSGSVSSISLFYPMERIFEDYVAQSLKTKVEEYFGSGSKLKLQSAKHSLVEDHIGSKIFNLRPDLLVLRDGKPICVLDTKWKLINSFDRRNKYGISQADMYQLYAYGHKYLKNNEEKELFLIFPMNENFKEPLPPFQYEDGLVLRVVPFDLNKGILVS